MIRTMCLAINIDILDLSGLLPVFADYNGLGSGGCDVKLKSQSILSDVHFADTVPGKVIVVNSKIIVLLAE